MNFIIFSSQEAMPQNIEPMGNEKFYIKTTATHNQYALVYNQLWGIIGTRT